MAILNIQWYVIFWRSYAETVGDNSCNGLGYGMWPTSLMLAIIKSAQPVLGLVFKHVHNILKGHWLTMMILNKTRVMC